MKSDQRKCQKSFLKSMSAKKMQNRMICMTKFMYAQTPQHHHSDVSHYFYFWSEISSTNSKSTIYMHIESRIIQHPQYVCNHGFSFYLKTFILVNLELTIPRKTQKTQIRKMFFRLGKIIMNWVYSLFPFMKYHCEIMHSAKLQP